MILLIRSLSQSVWLAREYGKLRESVHHTSSFFWDGWSIDAFDSNENNPSVSFILISDSLFRRTVVSICALQYVSSTISISISFCSTYCVVSHYNPFFCRWQMIIGFLFSSWSSRILHTYCHLTCYIAFCPYHDPYWFHVSTSFFLPATIVCPSYTGRIVESTRVDKEGDHTDRQSTFVVHIPPELETVTTLLNSRGDKRWGEGSHMFHEWLIFY